MLRQASFFSSSRLRRAGVSGSFRYDGRNSTRVFSVCVDDARFSDASTHEAYVTNVLDVIADKATQEQSLSFLQVVVPEEYKRGFVARADELVETAYEHAELLESFKEASKPATVAFYASLGLGLTSLVSAKKASGGSVASNASLAALFGPELLRSRASIAGSAVALSAVLARPVASWYVNRRTALAGRVDAYEAIRRGLD